MDYKYNEQQTKRKYKLFSNPPPPKIKKKKKRKKKKKVHKPHSQNASEVCMCYPIGVQPFCRIKEEREPKTNEKQTNKQRMRGHLNAFLLVVVFIGSPVRLSIAIKTLHAWM